MATGEKKERTIWRRRVERLRIGDQRRRQMWRDAVNEARLVADVDAIYFVASYSFSVIYDNYLLVLLLVVVGHDDGLVVFKVVFSL